MNNKFSIVFSCTSKDIRNRPPLSHKVREYYSDFLAEKLFKNLEANIKNEWCVELVVAFMEGGPRFDKSEIVLGRTAKKVTSEKIKIYEAIVPLKLVQVQNDGFDGIVDILQQCLDIFVVNTYKKITKEMMNNIWMQIDHDYLRSLPYPAPLSEQQYVGDIRRSDGSIEIYKF
jgi:hypothetical protein